MHRFVVSFTSNQGTGKWYEMQDLQVIDILPQMITLSEAYIQASLLTYSVDAGHLWSVFPLHFYPLMGSEIFSVCKEQAATLRHHSSPRSAQVSLASRQIGGVASRSALLQLCYENLPHRVFNALSI